MEKFRLSGLNLGNAGCVSVMPNTSPLAPLAQRSPFRKRHACRIARVSTGAVLRTESKYVHVGYRVVNVFPTSTGDGSIDVASGPAPWSRGACGTGAETWGAIARSPPTTSGLATWRPVIIGQAARSALRLRTGRRLWAQFAHTSKYVQSLTRSSPEYGVEHSRGVDRRISPRMKPAKVFSWFGPSAFRELIGFFRRNFCAPNS